MPDEDEIGEGALGTLVGPHVDRSPKQIEQQVLSVSDQSNADQLAAAIDAAEWLVCRAKSIQNLCRQIGVSWIEHNGDLTIGDITYSVGYQNTVKCLDPRGCGHELLKTVGGDFEEFLQTLVAQPFKHGSASKLLDQTVYRSFFVTKRTSRLVNGVPERTLKRIDTRFVSGRS